jgi:hypothetical protein
MSEEKLPLKLSEEEQAIEGVKELHPFIADAFAIKDTMIAIEVKDEASAELGNSKLKDAKILVKKIDEKRKEITLPFRNQTSAVNELAKKILGPIEDGIDVLSKRFTEYALEEEKRKAEELAKEETKLDDLTGKKSELVSLEKKIYNSVDKYDNMEDMNSMFQRAIQNKKGTGAWQKFVKECDSEDIKELADIAFKRIMRYGKAKKANISEDAGNDMKALRAELESEIEDSVLVTTNAETVEVASKVEELSNTKTSNVRKGYTIEVVDINQVPDEYKIVTIDEKKIKADLKAKLSDKILYKTIDENPDKVVPGLKLTKTLTHVGR